MPISPTDINIVYSGGPNNQDPLQSIGGEPSAYLIGSNINNIFSNITSQQSQSGYTDYRCFYVFNDNASITLLNAKIWIESQDTPGTTIALGVTTNNENQILTISGSPLSGTFILTLETLSDPLVLINTATITFSMDSNAVAANIQAALENLAPHIKSVEVTPANNYKFSILFNGVDSNKYYKTLNAYSFNQSWSGGSGSISISKQVSGGPINSTAPNIGTTTTNPVGINFSSPSSQEEATIIGDVGPEEWFPVWIQRTTAPGSDPTLNENFTFKLEGETAQ